ncbi:hypothetical protein ACJMK2_007418 [Sinanodonta woodiana]|uniref:C-type lectin domain-containing protein n=1 Tax=Sinanodonta woodiana TaxID=1069815 RepID=A0ABD3VLH8_SINWO
MDAQVKETTCDGDIPMIDKVPMTTAITKVTTTIPTTDTTTTATTTTIKTTTSTTAALSTATVGLVFGQVKMCPTQLTRNLLGQIGQSCYELVTQKSDWYTANINCLRKQAFLFHVSSDVENQAVLNMLAAFQQTEPVWMGLEDIGVEGVYKWVSGDPVAYTNWIPNHLSPDADIEDCVIFMSQNGGRWDDVACRGYLNGNHIHSFICQYKI